ncbi:MAG: hypothetical protein OEV00_14605 [Acidobacteriota bacterium]|nr:hypothetical protein [Acidobacteriota bacterium]MDH3786540.1 hypothetical protein [Acidobacteriota bacterium]
MKTTQPTNERRWRNVGVVREHDSARTLRAWGLWVALILALVPSIVFVLQRNHSVETRVRLNVLQQQLEEARRTERSLAIDWAGLSSPEKMEAWASKQRSLIRPSSRDVIAVTKAPDPTENLVAGKTPR